MSLVDHHVTELARLDPELCAKAVDVLRGEFTEVYPATGEAVRSAFEDDPDEWWVPVHFGWGMGVRNFLRTHVALDDKLPTGNWDDVWVPLVELALGLRDEKGTIIVQPT